MNALLLPAVADAPLFRPIAPRTSNHAAISFAIAAPLDVVYERWLQYPGFPHFMRGDGSGDPEEQGRITWRIRIHDRESPWEAESSEQIPLERLAWKNVSGRPSRNSGSVTFHPSGAERTRVTISIEFELSRWGTPGPDPLGALASRLERNLMKFAEFAVAEAVEA